MVDAYKPQDAMSLWWLGAGRKSAPRLIGRIFLADGNRKVGLEYASDWRQQGFALSEDLPLAGGVFLPKERDMAAGAVDDARPDRWGERVIRNLYKPARLSKLAVEHAPQQAQAADYIDEAERAFAGQLRDFIVGQAARLTQLADDAAKIKSEFL